MAPGTGQQTRRRLIEAARQTFAAVGVERASTSSIASVAGCSEPTLFKHFGSKTGLLVAVLGDAGATVLGRLEEARAASGGDFTAFVSQASALLADPLFAEMARLRSFALTRIDDPDVRAAVDDNIAGFDRLLDDVLAGGQRSGMVRSDVSAADLRELVLGLLLAAGFRHALNPASDGDPSRPLASLVLLIRPAPTAKGTRS